jgi:hypothetical protein
MHVDQRAAGKGRETLDAVDQPDRRVAVEGQHAEGLRQIGQASHQVVAGVGVQGMAATGRITCVGVEQVTSARACTGSA